MPPWVLYYTHWPNIRDQALHVAWQFWICGIASFGGASPLSVFALGQWFLAREFIDQVPPNKRWPLPFGRNDKLHDIFWFEAGVLMTLTVEVVL